MAVAVATWQWRQWQQKWESRDLTKSHIEKERLACIGTRSRLEPLKDLECTLSVAGIERERVVRLLDDVLAAVDVARAVRAARIL